MVIDSSVSSATFVIAWGGSDLDLVLIRPDGGIIDPSVAAVDPDIAFVSASTYEFYEVNAPMPGEWIMQTTGVETAPGGENYTASVSVSSAMIFSFELDKLVYLPLDTMKLVTTLEDPIMDIPDPQPILGASVTATVNDPYGNVYSIILYDDGLHGDNSANDGIYGNTFSDTAQIGSYTFRVDASGELNRGGAFTRTATKSIVIAQDSDNDGMNDAWEDIYGLDKYRDDAGEDPDNDLLTNIEEYNHRTNPQNPDTDGDSYNDSIEIQEGTDPLDPNDFPGIVFTITATAGSGGSISPSGSLSITEGNTQSFTIEPQSGYQVSTVSGCEGSLTGNIYTTAPVYADCTVTADFTPTPVALQVVSPDGGEALTSGTIHVIRWNAALGAAYYRLNYSLDNGASWNFIQQVGAVTSFDWLVADVTWTQTNCRIMVRAYNSGGTQLECDISDASFTINPTPFRVVSPNGGETLASGTIHTIQWIAAPQASYYRLNYSLDNGVSWNFIQQVEGVTSFDWLVADVSGVQTNCRILVRAYNASGTHLDTDISDGVFTIQSQ